MYRYLHQVIIIVFVSILGQGKAIITVSRGASLKIFSHTSQTEYDCQKLLLVRRLAHTFAAVSR